MEPITRTWAAIIAAFAAWCAIVALRAIFTKPYEILWFTGIGAAFLCAATCGYLYARLKPNRDARRARRVHRG